MTAESGTGTIDNPPWLGIELRHLAALDALARAQSFRGAAERLGYVQSAVSQQIAHCERVVGMILVERRRGHRTALLTEAGHALAAHAAAIMAQLDAARADLAPFVGNDETPRLRIGVAPSLGSTAGLRLTQALHRLDPSLAVETVEPTQDGEIEALASDGDVDLALGECGGEPGHLASRTLFADPYILIVPARSPAAGKSFVGLDDLRRLPLLAPSAAQGLGHAERHLRAHGVTASQTSESVGIATVQALVAQGSGAAVLPRRAVGTRERGIVAISLKAVLPPRPVGLAHRGAGSRFPADARSGTPPSPRRTKPPKPAEHLHA